jgi:plastocyanin
MTRAYKMLSFQVASIVSCGLMMLTIATMTKAAPPPAATLVHIGNFTFNQAAITVHPGTTVTWVNDDDIPHTVVAQGLAFKSKVLDTGDRFSFTFAKAGQFGYFCSLHPHMTGKVIVKA